MNLKNEIGFEKLYEQVESEIREEEAKIKLLPYPKACVDEEYEPPTIYPNTLENVLPELYNDLLALLMAKDNSLTKV